MLGSELEVLIINLQVGGGNAILVISELLLDQLPGELWLPLALKGQSLQQLKNRSFRVTSRKLTSQLTMDIWTIRFRVLSQYNDHLLARELLN